MTKTPSLDQYKIPAFQRKRSLSAKARRSAKPVTALERRIAGIPVVKPKRVVARRSIVRRAVSSRAVSSDSSYGSSYSSPLVDDIPTYSGSSYEAPAYESPSRYLGGSSYGSESSLFGGSADDMDDSVSDSGGSYSRGESYSSSLNSISGESLPDLREMRLCGKCEGYLEKIQVAIVTVSAPLRVGDRVIFESESGGLFEQNLGEMQINREDVMTAYSGDDIGMKVKAVPKKNGNVYKVI